MDDNSESDGDFHIAEARNLVSLVNRKKKKSGGFSSMGLCNTVLKGIMKKGYKLPTPIQRKSIPIILSGRDIVAMARTGSGKTAAFLIPLFEKFQSHSSLGPRALIMSPTRELAIQTLNFTKELGKFTPLKATIILGGDKMEEQFSALHKCPDIIIATPGRMLHIMMEMNLPLKTVEYVVFDEGDRLFELGFAEQLSETLKRLPRIRQTLIFSATLPKTLVEFVRAGLSDPVLIRLDVDNKLSKDLKLAYVGCLSDEKIAILLHMLNKIISANEQVVIFFATKNHVEYFQLLLTDFGFKTTCIHSGLDPIARNQALKQFKSRVQRILLVTDVAARGVDVPFLDNVINFHFPVQPKLFLHRVGRVARAGRHGIAYSLIDTDELPYMLDVFMFLGKKWLTCNLQDNLTDTPTNEWESDRIGRPFRTLATNYASQIKHVCSSNTYLESLHSVCVNAMKRFCQIRPKASTESVRRAKELRDTYLDLPVHDLFKGSMIDEDSDNNEILNVIKNLKLPTIFEALGKHSNPDAFATMAEKRKLHDGIIARHANNKLKTKESAAKALLERKIELTDQLGTQSMSHDGLESLEHLELFVPYSRGDDAAERGLAVNGAKNQFNLDVEAASFDMHGDSVLTSCDGNGARKRPLVWDRKRKKFTGADALNGKANMKRIKTESGVWIPASYKTDKYEQWLKRSKSDMIRGDEPQGTFSAKYGSVIEFPDTPDDTKMHFRPKHKAKHTSDETKSKFTVIGHRSWHERATINQREHKQNMLDKANIRQPKGNRTYGQLRKPEQILKQRRYRAKQMDKAKNSNKKSGPGKGKKSFASKQRRK